jgi:glycosyltransferase involved in cell wall biosynthesis
MVTFSTTDNAFSDQIILHDYFETAEGGGRLCLTLSEAYHADLCYGFKASFHPFFQNAHFCSRQYDLRSASRIPLLRQLRLMHAFRNKTSFLNNYRQAIYSGFYSPLAMNNHQRGSNIYYCHTPPRFMYDQRDFYSSRLPFLQRFLLVWFIGYLKPLYEEAIASMDIIIANSENVRARIRTYLKKDALVVYPPCDTDSFIWRGQADYYLSTARLDVLKRVDLIIDAFIRMPDKKLIVTSEGNDYARLKKLAGQRENILFTGLVTEEKLRDLTGNAIATIYIPRDEDFGMSPVESMAAGKPVIGVREGGLLETIVHGETGILLSPEINSEELIDAVSALTPACALQMRRACEERAQLFSQDLFLDKMLDLCAGNASPGLCS